MNTSRVAEQLAGLPVPQVRYFDTIGSTNDEALGWITAGAEDGSLVVADQQTRGRGRLGRRWVTRPGAALAFSLVLRPRPGELGHLGLYSPLGALAICQALEESLGLTPQVKWPNDVLLQRRKVAGILVEAAWTGAALDGLVIGIGVNVTPAAVPPPGELLFPAVSIEEASGHPVDRLDLLRSILRSLFDWRARLGSQGFRQAWEERLAFRGEWVKISAAGNNAPLTGQVIGLTDDGGLRLRGVSGDEMTVAVGDVHLHPVD